MSDIVARLRDTTVNCVTFALALEAADEIERLTSEVARLHVTCRDRFDEIEWLRSLAHEWEAEARECQSLIVESTAERERLRAELAAERAARVAVASPVRQEGEE